MDKRTKRIIAEIDRFFEKKPDRVPQKLLQKLFNDKTGDDKLRELFIATKNAVEQGKIGTAIFLSALTLTYFPRNADAWSTFDSLSSVEKPTPNVWKLIEDYLKKSNDHEFIIKLREKIRLFKQEQLIEEIDVTKVNADPLLLTLKIAQLRKNDSKAADSAILTGLDLLSENRFPTPIRAEFVYFACEHLQTRGKHFEIKALIEPLINDEKLARQIPQNRRSALNAMLANAMSSGGDDIGALRNLLPHSIFELEYNEVNSRTVYNVALLLSKMDLRETAGTLYELAFKMDPTAAQAGFHALYQKSHVCNWYERNLLKNNCEKSLNIPFAPGDTTFKLPRMLASCAFSATTLFDSLDIQSALIDRGKEAASAFPTVIYKRANKGHCDDKIKIAYLSADIYSHATAYLISGLIEAHDRDKFEIHIFSYGFDNTEDPFRARIREAVGNRFLDVSRWSDEAVAASIKNQKIDIAVDLKGFTQNSRPFLLSSRPAPIQINYLGYPGSMALPYIDYFVGDRYTVNEINRRQFTEKVITLPTFYQPPDINRKVADEVPQAKLHDLPSDKVALGAFNSIYKLSPEVYSTWLSILKATENSVLWMIEPDNSAKKRLRLLSREEGIKDDRIIFAPHVNQSLHINRLQLIDVFLDTFPCVGHTTATDVLFQGIPLVTIAGKTFASRVAAGALHFIDCEELIADSLENYQQIIQKLIVNEEHRASIKRKIKLKTAEKGLYNTDRYTKGLESAYKTIYQRWLNDEKPSDLLVKIN